MSMKCMLNKNLMISSNCIQFRTEHYSITFYMKWTFNADNESSESSSILLIECFIDVFTKAGLGTVLRTNKQSPFILALPFIETGQCVNIFDKVNFNKCQSIPLISQIIYTMHNLIHFSYIFLTFSNP